MKYTIPYDDKITLPHIKKIESISINTDRLNYDKKELAGEVIISGDFMVDNNQDIMEFTHDIPVSFLIDDQSISPQINISNFKYELIPSRGIEVMFELDIILIEEEVKEEEVVPRKKDNVIENNSNQETDEDEDIKQFQNKIEENLDIALNKKKPVEEKQEIKREVEEDHNEDKKRLNLFKKDKNKEVKKDKIVKEVKEVKEVKKVEEIIPDEATEEVIEDVMGLDLPDDDFKTNISSSLQQFNPGFIPRENDKFTTYKIILVEPDDNVDELLETRNLSKALICKEYNFDHKVVLKLENE